MFKKGLVTLVCLTVMSALWAWATTTYSISTKINSLGTVKVGTRVVNGVTFDRFTTVIGGTIKVRNVTLNKDINAQDRSIKYSQLLSSDTAEVVVSPKPGYKIATLSKTGTGVGTFTVTANQITDVTIPVTSPNPLATQYIVATFAPEGGTTATVTKNWQLQVMNNSAGGTIKVVRATATDNYSTVGKALVKSYIDTTPVNVTVTPASGYSVAYVILDGVKQYSNPFATAVDVVPSGSSRLKTIVVGYKKNAIRVTTHQAAEITTDAVTGGIRYADNGILPANPAADPTGAVRLVVTPTGANNVVKTFGVTAGTFTGTIKYFDRFGAPLTALPPVGPVKVTITGITDPISVGATYGMNAAESARVQNCTQTCHVDPELLKTKPEVAGAATDWKTSPHATTTITYYTNNGGIDCIRCHKGMPSQQAMTAANTCQVCHSGTHDVETGDHPILGHVSGADCITCHNSHSTDAKVNHAGGAVAPGHAQFVSPTVTCTNCHAGTTSANAAILVEFNQSGHGNPAGEAWAHYDWRATPGREACQRCHNGTAFAGRLDAAGLNATTNFFAAPVPVAPGEVLNCSACHANVATGELRAAANAFTVNLSNGATVAYDVPGASALCARCHGGRETGNSIKGSTSDFKALSFINSHYLAAAGTVYNKTGYEFAGQTYDNLGFHKNVGKANFAGTGANGPCVVCHMSVGQGHTWTASAASPECAKCHEGGLTAAKLEEAKEEVHTALEALKAALAAKKILFVNAHPYFYKDLNSNGVYDEATEAGSANAFKNWDGVYPGKGKDVMGAAFNYNLFEHEPGAFAHNKQYTLKLIADSIDFLNDGVIDGDSGITVEASHIAVATADNTSCNNCHSGTTTLAVPHAGTFSNECVSCHNNAGAVVASETESVTAAHAVTGQVVVSNVNVTTDATNVTMTFNVKVDGADANNFTVLYGGKARKYAASATATATPFTVPATTTQPEYNVSNVTADFTRADVVPTVASNGNGNYTVTFAGTTAAATTYLVTLSNGATPTPKLATAVGHLNGNPRSLTSNEGCFNCHGYNAFKGAEHHGANPQTVEACVVCHTRATSISRGEGGDRLTAYVHGIHNSHNMPAGGYDRQFPTKDGVLDFEVGYPTYMTNCSVCHKDGQLTAVNAAKVSYSLCMSCHDTFESFDHGNTTFGTYDHKDYNWNTDCQSCHNGTTARDTVVKFHNGLMTERSGLLYNGQDVSVVEGAKVDMQITGVTRTATSLSVTWKAFYNGVEVNPCNTTPAAGAPIFAHGGTVTNQDGSVANQAKFDMGQVNGNLSLLRGYVLGDDWGNPGIGTSPGQPASTNLSTSNTTCASNVATTTITLTDPEKAATGKAIVALQGKAQVKLGYTYDNPLTPAVEAKDVIQVRSKTPTQEYMIGNGELVARRQIADTASCLGCHVGSLYQHGGNRIDNVDMCVMCHNEASSEQSVRVFDGVTANEAYDGKVGQTYGFKSLLHAIHSAGENDAITMVYRTNGNYVWAKDTSLIPNYPTVDVLGLPLQSGGAPAVIYGSSAPHGTGVETGVTGPSAEVKNAQGAVIIPAGTIVPYKEVARVHNLHVTEFPKALNDCASCHKANSFGFPNPSKAIATVVDVVSVKADQTSSSDAVYGNINDDIVQGPAAAACMSCHATATTSATGKTKAWYSNHANGGGFAPVVRTSAGTENCASCHK